jgi:hypothetical protein
MSTPVSTAIRRENIISLASKIEELDQRMQAALEAGALAAARELAEEQERLLSFLMVVQEEG